eukprot:9379551-Pyramimonas_sp.AAC.1
MAPRRAWKPAGEFLKMAVSLQTSSTNRPRRGLRIDIVLESLSECFRTAHRRPKRRPRGPQERSRAPLEDPKRPPRALQEAPRQLTRTLRRPKTGQ